MRRNVTKIPPLTLDRAPLLARPYLQSDSPLAAMLAYVPELLEATMPFVSTVLGPSHLGERLKHLVVLRTSVRNGCRYCTRVYSDRGDSGLSDEDMAAIRAPQPHVIGFDERERAALAFVDRFCSEPSGSVDSLSALFRDDEIVALVTIAGATDFLNRFAMALGLE